jgi:hypothetical protein
MFWTPDRLELTAWTEHVPFAFWLVDVLRPRRIVELGTYNGVSYSALCQAVKMLDLTTSCYAVDTWHGDEQSGFYEENVYREFAAFHDHRYSAFSHLVRSSFDDALARFEQGSIDLLHIDGLHTYEAVRHDYESWLPKLSVNAIILLHDTNTRERNFGVFRLWNEISVEKLHFNFLHGHGLGVLGAGHDYPDALRVLFNASKDDRLLSGIRETFEIFGRSVRILSERLGFEKALSECSGEIDGMRYALLKRAVEVSALQQAVAERSGEIDRLHQTVQQQASEIAALRGDLTADCSGERDAINERHKSSMSECDAQPKTLADHNRQFDTSRSAHSALAKKDAELNRILASRSWRMTRPLRFAGRLLRGEWPLVLAGLRLATLRATRALHNESSSDTDPQPLSLTECSTEMVTPQQEPAQYSEKIQFCDGPTSSPVAASPPAIRRLLQGFNYTTISLPIALAWRALTTRSQSPLREWRAYKAIAYSGLFDIGWYLENNADVAASGVDPILHYVMHGALETRDPCPSFSTAGYLQCNVDVATAGINPFAHFILYGATEGRKMNLKQIDNDKKIIHIISTKHTLFIAHSIDYYLSREGYTVSISNNYNKNVDKFDIPAIYIVICPQVFSELPSEFIAFQMEQSTSDRWFNEEYKAILSSSLAVIDYSLHNISYLNKFISSHQLFHVPINPIGGYLNYLISRYYKLNLSPKKFTDVMFYGDTNCPRRFEFLQKLKKRFSVKVISGIYEEELVNEIIGARLVINVHYYDISLLETTRICEALSIGVPVVSEESADIEQYEELRAVVEFTRMGDPEAMMQAIDRLLSDDNFYQERLMKIRSFVNNEHRFPDYFKRFLVAQGKFPYKRFQDTSRLLPYTMPTTPRICLSVPEYTARRSSFVKKDRSFILFDGVRYHPGWVGASMSYKYIFSKLIDTNCSRVVICEDDVVFKEGFSERLAIIDRFLDSTCYPWDIFSGLIADLHPDVEITRIVQFEDHEFIFMNKMTSNVFNIYNRSSFIKIAAWDENNMDVKSNTIDRYIEAANNIIIVTTLPFLVDHDEELSSSLWNFQNSEYLTMFEKTQTLLEKKISEFKKETSFNGGNGTITVHE